MAEKKPDGNKAASEKTLPAVSVIVPVFNGELKLPALLASLAALDYPRQLLEILIVDNASTDRTAEIIRGSGFTYVLENRAQSSYAARNRGIESSSGEILAFTDDDCRVDPGWVREGVLCLEKQAADMAAGAWTWEIEQETVSALYTRATFGRQDYLAGERAVAATANFMARRQVFEKMGLFDERIIFGGDTEFTARASSSGFKIVYCEKAVVHHRAHHDVGSIYRKWRRTGFGKALKTFYLGEGNYHFRELSWYLPGIRQFIEFRGREKLSAGGQVKGFFLVWFCKLAFAVGNRKGYQYCLLQKGGRK